MGFQQTSQEMFLPSTKLLFYLRIFGASNRFKGWSFEHRLTFFSLSFPRTWTALAAYTSWLKLWGPFEPYFINKFFFFGTMPCSWQARLFLFSSIMDMATVINSDRISAGSDLTISIKLLILSFFALRLSFRILLFFFSGEFGYCESDKRSWSRSFFRASIYRS